MFYSFPELVFLFFIYSFIGWLWETVYCSILDRHFVYRGFLFGPYCPVYGFAVTTVLIFTQPFQANLLSLFLSGMVIATVFEYLAGWFLETFFHMILWDYSHEKGNIKGRIAPRISLFWGLAILILVKWIQPYIMTVVLKIPSYWAFLIMVVMLADLVWTVVDTVPFHKAALSLENKIRDEQNRMQENVRQEVDGLAQQAELFSQRLEKFRRHAEDFLQEKNIKPFYFNQRRLMKNYSQFKGIDVPFVTELRKQMAHFRKTPKNKK